MNMGVQALQDYVESHCPKGCKNVEMKDFVKARKSDGFEAVVVVDAFSCVRYLYGYNSDWVCGGQWSEMLRNVENFVRSFRMQNIQMIVFMAGEGESLRLLEWIKTQEKHRQTVQKVLNHVIRQANFPPKRLFFLPPAAQMCLRLAFRSCGVPVCCSFFDLHQELVTYCKEEQCCGLIGHDSAYLLLNPPAYLSAEQLTVNKKNITLKHFDLDAVFNEMGLEPSRLGLFASLLGTSFIPEEVLSSFHWAIVGSDNPAARNQTNCQSVLPPNNVVIRKMVEYVNKIADTTDYGTIVSQVFRDTTVDQKAMEELLQQSVQYYDSNREPHDSKGKKEHLYKKRWQHWQQHQLVSQPLASTQVKEENGQEPESEVVNQLQENINQLNVENNGITEQPVPMVTPQSPVIAPEVPGTQAISPPATPYQAEMVSPPLLFPTPPPSVEGSPSPISVIAEQAESNLAQTDPDSPPIKGVIKSISSQVLDIVKQRHQSGQMNECIYQILTRAEITIGAALEDEHFTDHQPTPLLYRPIRQCVYGILFDKKAHEQKQGTQDAPLPPVKEWCVYRGEKLDKPDLVEGVSMRWNIPGLHHLWFGKDTTDNLNRMKAFLTCLCSDTPNMTKTTMVPQRLVIMCCILRYLLQQGKPGQPVLLRHEVDAFLTAALSPHISSEFNPANLSQLKLLRVEARGVQLASIFMSGVEAASLANDACGCPVPWELLCPWNYFDGKLFMTKYLQASSDATPLELCDGKNARLEKLQRMRWCIMESIAPELVGVRLPNMGGFRGPVIAPCPPMSFFGMPGMPMPMHNNFLPAGARIPQQIPLADRPRTRGVSSKRPVSGLGGTLEVAGVPVANWGGNRAGRDYSEHSRIVAGGAGSVELPSRGRTRGGRGGRRGGYWPNTRNVTWAVEVDKDYDRRIGYQEHNSRSTNIHQVPDQPMVLRGQCYAGLDNTIPDLSAPPHFTAPLSQPPMNMHMAVNKQPSPQPGVYTEEKTPISQVHILAKPSVKLASQGRGRGIAASLTNNVGTFQAAKMSTIGRGYLLEKPQHQTPAT